MANTSSQRLIVNLGSQSNDGTGDAIRDAFNKVNLNFETIFNVAGLGSGLTFTKLADAPKALSPNKLSVSDATGLTLTQMTLVGAHGIQVTVDQTFKQIKIDATVTNLVNDPNPALSANLSGSNAYRAINFNNPIDDQDLATKKWIYDNFLNRDSNYQYISSVNPITQTNNTSTIVEGSTLRHNIQLVPASINTSTNAGKVIDIYDATGASSTLDISVGGWLPSHLTRKDYVDTKISLQGIDTIDPLTGEVNPGFGQMTGPLYLSRDPIETDPGNVAATKAYVDSTGFPSKSNFFVSLTGNDSNFTIPPYKRGRSWAWSFKTVQRAAQAALQYSKASEIKLGVYQREITTNGYTELVVIERIDPSSISADIAHAKINVLYTGGSGGTDPFLERSIRPGMYLQGVDSNAISEILNVSLTGSSNSEEYYEIQYVDYAETFNSPITPDGVSGRVTFTFFNPNIIEVPDFWVGYKFIVDNGPSGTIESVGLYYAPNGNVYDTITVLLDSALNNANIISGSAWHVYSGFFIKGEALRYGQRYNKLEISIMVESGEYNEQLPIRIGDNISVKGDEFRRTVIKPAYILGTARTSISTSEWADIYFRRDTQVDGIITVQLNTSTDYATLTTITPNGQTNDPSSGVITFTLGAGLSDPIWVGKVLTINDGNGTKGKIVSAIGTTFSVDIAENTFGNRQLSVGAGVSITSGTWHIYTPINFGYHYLRDATQPLNYIAGPNGGGYNNSAAVLELNRQFIQAETIAFINSVYGGTLVYDQGLWSNNFGTVIDSLAYDLKNGNVWASINAADSYFKDRSTPVAPLELTATLDAITHINAVAQTILAGGTVTRTTGNTISQVTSTLPIETGAAATVFDLTFAMGEILNGNPTFNPPKYNDQMDIFLMNDATMLRYLGGNGHGGFMKVLDPEGQIKSKSPYTQTCSSFSQSTGKHEFRGGFFVDGFAGNLPMTVDHSQLSMVNGNYYALNDGNATHLVRIPVTGLVRKPVFPTFFLNDGISYEVDYIESYNATAGTGILHLNPNNPGGIDTVSINSGNTFAEFKPATSVLPITISNPGTAGSITSRGYASVDGAGNISSITITYPGKGYVSNPSIILGGATFNFIISSGSITSMTINNGGVGYTTGTSINIASPGGSGTSATASITSVDSNGAITGINLSYGGTGYSLSATPTVTFGRQIFTANIKIGFVGPLPTAIELNASGNRSMLANDFTQLNDLAYGIFCTNGGFIENVSMFTYYCWTSYYALNGAQVRTITGSSAYGHYGLVSEGSNPNEIPTAISLPDELSQIAVVYNQAPYTNKATGSDLYVTLDSTYGYAPYPESEVEINHNGLRKTYAVNNAVQVAGNLYDLSLNTTGGGLFTQVPDGAVVTIRVKNQWRLYGLNANSVTRPSTVLTLDEDPTYNYRVLSYTDKGSDYALTETDQAYDYIQLNPYVANNQYRQGVGRPSISSAGTGYGTSSTWAVTFAGPTTKTAVINGNQGSINSPVTQVTIGSVSGAIHIGTAIVGGGALTNQYVTWVSADRTTIQTSLAQYWTASNSISFVGTTATGVAYANTATGAISRVVITDPGTGYDSAPVGSVAGGNNNAVIGTSLSGNSGTSVIKVLPLSGVNAARISAGLTSSTQYHYVFGFEGVRYQITNYLPPSTTGQVWGEIEVNGYYNSGGSYATLQNEMMLDPLYAGVSRNTYGHVTIQISTLRATSHDMVDIGTGGYATSKIPNDLYGPPTIPRNQAQETKELNKGRVYFVTTDQDGNFRVGKYFAVDQGRGTVTISAPISLTGINKLSFKKGVSVDEFSIDDTMAANSLSKVPVESAIVSYLDHRLGIDRTGAKATGFIGPGVMALNGINPMTGALSMGSNKITTMAVPTNSSDAATKGYSDTKISLAGMNEVTNNGGQLAGAMTGPLRLSQDPASITASTTGTVSIGNTVLYLNSVSALYVGMQVNNSVATGSTITNVDTVHNAVTISPAAIGTLSTGTVITFDPVQQGATKRYVDKVQFNTLRDVSLTSPTDTDFPMFAGALSANSGTSTPLYTAATQVVNVRNNSATITNTSSSAGGGSDVTLVRSGNTITIKLVGGQGNANPITDYHVNNSAAIQQSKLNMQAAVTSISAPGTFTQSALGLSVFNSSVFTAANGWISLADATNTTSGIAPSKIQWTGAGGGLLGATNLGASVATTYLNSSTVRTWLGVIDASAGGTFRGDLYVNNIFANTNNTYDLGSTGSRFRTVYGVTGNFSGNVTDNNNRVVTSVTPTAGNSISITSLVTTGPASSWTIDTVQDIRTSASPTFNGLTLSSLTSNGTAIVNGTWQLGAGAKFQATYADLAERYSSDSQYEPGTIVVFGGAFEVTLSTMANDRTVAGVITTNPAYLMNVDIEGVDVALQGRVPCKVVGTIKKGDMIVTSNIPGVGMANNDPKMGTVIGKALEDYNSTEVGVIEVAVGRL
jgi:hypothetical protein